MPRLAGGMKSGAENDTQVYMNTTHKRFFVLFQEKNFSLTFLIFFAFPTQFFSWGRGGGRETTKDIKTKFFLAKTTNVYLFQQIKHEPAIQPFTDPNITI